MSTKKPCTNFNHSRSYVTICHCPQCGEKFKPFFSGVCEDDKHKQRRKEGHTFCIDCGKKVKGEH